MHTPPQTPEANASASHIVPPARPARRGATKPPFLLSGVLNALRTAQGKILSTSELVELIYGGMADGGPLYAAENIKSTVYTLRRKGFPIKTHGHRGYSFSPTLKEIPVEVADGDVLRVVMRDPPAHELPAGLPTPEGARQGVPSLTCGAADQSSPEIDMNTAAPAFWGEAFPDEAAGAMLRRMLPGLRADLAWIFGRRAADLPRTLPAEMYDGHPTP
jgi:hypothetical protein